MKILPVLALLLQTSEPSNQLRGPELQLIIIAVIVAVDGLVGAIVISRWLKKRKTRRLAPSSG